MFLIPKFASCCAIAACLLLSACGSDSRPAAPSDPAEAGPINPGGNRSPVIGGTPPASTHVDSPWRFQPIAQDPDGDAMQFFVENSPPWTTFDHGTGLLEGTPGEGDVGEFSNIRISVTDGLATARLRAFSVEVLPSGSSTGSATLSWTPPTERVDGSPIGGLAGYRVLWGKSPGAYDRSYQIENPSVTTYIVENLSPGTWYFAVTAKSRDGLESAPSPEARKRIDG